MKLSPRLAPALRLLGCAAAAALASGCAGGPFNPFAAPPVDPASPVAAEVATAARTNRAYPTFGDIPTAPSDQRPLRAWGEAAADLRAAGDQLTRDTAPDTWSLADTQAFADEAQARIGRDAGPVAASDTEAFARSARQRATPPPSPR